MLIRIKLLATYRRLLPPTASGNMVELDLPEKTSLRDALTPLGVPLDESSVILLNGRTVSLDTLLQAGDEISAFSAIAGG